MNTELHSMPPVGEDVFGRKDLDYFVSSHYRLKDLTACRAALKVRYDNWPWAANEPDRLLLNLANLAQNFLQPLWEIDGTLQIMGCWRSPDLFLNKNALFESYNPNPDLELAHTEGRAVDIFVPGQPLFETVNMIRQFRLRFDLMVVGEQEPILAGRSWVHITQISALEQQRFRVLKAQNNGTLTPIAF